jgi:Icc-related predicted phosphoesterase
MAQRQHLLFLGLLLLTLVGVACSHSGQAGAPTGSVKPVALQEKIPPTFTFVAFGDTRFHDPSDTGPANPAVRRALVAAIDKEQPAFISIGGDIVYVGENTGDWSVWDSETAIWREHKIPIYPALGNHDVKGSLQKALANYFARFPDLHESRFYSVRADNMLLLVLDSNQDELSGAQGDWFRTQLEQVPSSADFVFLVFHHPVITSSSDEKEMGGGHSVRTAEQALGQLLEEKQKHIRARFVVFNGHVHNYERHEHGGITYFVTGGGGAHAYPIPRRPDDLYQDSGINYHYLLVRVDHNRLVATMKKLEFKDGKEVWTQPDKVTITAPLVLPAAAD